MPEFDSKYFGRIQYSPESLIEFPAGLPGFDQERWFVLIQQPVNQPLVFLQSVSSPGLCFITLPVRCVAPDFQIRLNLEEARLLGLDGETSLGQSEDTLCLGIIAVDETGSATINLRAPLVIRYSARRAVQAIPEESPYSHQHPLEPQPQGALCS